MLLHLIDDNDSEVQQFFRDHIEVSTPGMDKGALIAGLIAKTEEAYQAMLVKFLSNE